MRTSLLRLILVVWFLLCFATTATAVCLNVYFVRIGGTPGVGTQQDPDNALPMFIPGGFDVLYLLDDLGATLDPGSTVILSEGQKLIGETIGYQDDCNDIAANPSVELPTMTGNVLPFLDAPDIEVAGVRVVGSINGADGADIHDNVLVDGGIIQLLALGVTGDVRIVGNEVLNALQVGIAVRQGDDLLTLSIEGNQVADAATGGIRVDQTDEDLDFGTLILRDNTVLRTGGVGLEIDARGAEFLIEDNDVIGTTGHNLELFGMSGVGLVRGNTFDEADDASIYIPLSESGNALDLTIENNQVLDTRGFVAENVGDGIEFEFVNTTTLVALVKGNTIDGKGGAGINVGAGSDVSIRLEGNTIRDVQSHGITFDDEDSNAELRAEVAGNDIDRTGGDGVFYAGTFRIFGPQSLSVTDNDIDDAGGDGIGLAPAGQNLFELDFVLDLNRITGSGGHGIHVRTPFGAANGELDFSVRNNTVSASQDDGVQLDILGAFTADGRIESNSLSANLGFFDIDVAATLGQSAGPQVCTRLADNDTAAGYRLSASGATTNHQYEDVLASNVGTATLDEMDQATLEAVASGTCDDVTLLPVPAPQMVQLPEPSGTAPPLLALAFLVRLRRLRKRGG